MKDHPVFRLIQRLEKGDALNMVPVKMGQKHIQVQLLVGKFLQEGVAKSANPGAGIEDKHFVVGKTHLDAAGISPVIEVFNLWCGS